MLRITAELPKMVGTIATYIVYDKAEGASHFRATFRRPGSVVGPFRLSPVATSNGGDRGI